MITTLIKWTELDSNEIVSCCLIFDSITNWVIDIFQILSEHPTPNSPTNEPQQLIYNIIIFKIIYTRLLLVIICWCYCHAIVINYDKAVVINSSVEFLKIGKLSCRPNSRHFMASGQNSTDTPISILFFFFDLILDDSRNISICLNRRVRRSWRSIHCILWSADALPAKRWNRTDLYSVDPFCYRTRNNGWLYQSDLSNNQPLFL